MSSLLLSVGIANAQTSEPVKIGILNDQSGIYADLAGPGSVVAAKLAAEDAGGSVLGRPIEILVADHQGKPDIGANLARKWYDVDGVTAIIDLPVSSIALAVQQVAREKNKIVIFSSASSSDLLGKSCGPTSFQWTFNTASSARSTASAILKDGGNSWFRGGRLCIRSCNGPRRDGGHYQRRRQGHWDSVASARNDGLRIVSAAGTEFRRKRRGVRQRRL
jgi:branched-chain amino acid transport system substrate-binding protein